MATSLLERLRNALAPQYEVERELGTGGMGSVFLAGDPNLDRYVAIKVLRPDLASEVAPERFQREARVLARLKHPNIVPVYQAGEAGGLSYYVMDFVEGETLAQRLKRGTMPKSEALRLADNLLSALAAAHQEGIIHRDVKPENIFLVGDRAVLVDFGIAKPVEESGEPLTADDRRVGTPAYMAPEQFTGDVVTPATDIYAVGMSLYEALTGRKWSIFTATDEGDWSGVPADLRPGLRRALAWLPSERWVDASTFQGGLAGTHSSPMTRRSERVPSAPSRITALNAVRNWIPYPYRSAAWAGLTWLMIAFLLLELVVWRLVSSNLVPPVVYDVTLSLLLAGLPLSMFIAYRRVRSSETRSER